MKPVFVMMALFMAASVAFAQGKGGPPAPPLMECGVHGDIDILCGTRSPEDLELTPDGKSLIVSQFVSGPAGAGVAGLMLFDPAKKTFTRLPISAEPRKDWGDPACPGPIGDALRPHGISLLKRTGGAIQLFVVNHGGRESIEMFELKQSGGTSNLIWHGCVVSMQAFNDVAAQPDGGFIATHPTALQPPRLNRAAREKARPAFDLFSGQPSGYVSRWTAGKGRSGTARHPRRISQRRPGELGRPLHVLQCLDRQGSPQVRPQGRQGNRHGQAGLHARQHLLDQQAHHACRRREGRARRLSGRQRHPLHPGIRHRRNRSRRRWRPRQFSTPRARVR